MTNGNEAIPTIFDADNHYWETSDAFTRHRDPKFADRGVTLVDVDGKPRVHVRRAAAPDHPGPGRRAPAPASGRALRLLRGPELQGARSATSWRARSRRSIRSGSTATRG